MEKQVTNEKEDNIKLKERVDELGDKNSHICIELQVSPTTKRSILFKCALMIVLLL